MNNLKVGKRLAIVFGLVAIVMAILAAMRAG